MARRFFALTGDLLALLALATLVGGCSSGPSAPALDDDPIYRNSREGLRFNRPDGWVQWARGDVPAGKLDGERLLVEYKFTEGENAATLEVSVASVDPSIALADYVAKNTLAPEDWRIKGAREDFRINGEPAVRLIYVTGADKAEMVREIVAFRRGERMYFFKGYYDASDGRARRDIRSAVDTVVW